MAKGWTTAQEIDPDKVPDGPPPPLDPGVYFATIAKAEPEETKKGDPAIKLELMVTHAHGGSPGDLKRKVFDKAVFTQETAWRVKQLAKSVGVDMPTSNAYDTVDEFCGSLVESNGVWVRLKQETFNEKTNARVDRYLTEEQAAEVASSGSADGKGGESASPRRRKRR